MESTPSTTSSLSDSIQPTYLESIIHSLVDLYNSINKQTLLTINISKLSKLLLKSDHKPQSILSEKEIQFYKYISIIIVPLTFFSMDAVNIKFNHQKLKDYINQLIHYSINFISSYKKHFLQTFKSFLKQTNNKYESVIKTSKNIVKLIYSIKTEYATLRKSINQLIENCSKLSLENIINYINNTILYCNNIKQKIQINIQSQSSNGSNGNNSNNNSNNSASLIPSSPYITEPLMKKFCLVLDMDETLSHSISPPSGSYFLLRPYVHEFLESVVHYYEIIIFTSSPVSYADNILNKIDLDKKYFKYRLYRKHSLYIDNKTVKDLSMIGRDICKVVLVDNIKDNARYQKDNLILIKTWEYDNFDTELIKIKDKLIKIATDEKYSNDIRIGIKEISI
jgi:Dullard-like phosphatase family protein